MLTTNENDNDKDLSGGTRGKLLSDFARNICNTRMKNVTKYPNSNNILSKYSK